jgi:hypothetical protein
MRSWETRVAEYVARSIQLEEQNTVDGNPANAEGWAYAPLIFWPSEQAPFLSDVLAVVQSDVTSTITLPSAYNAMKTAIQTFISAQYPAAGPEYRMISLEHDNGGSLPAVSRSTSSADAKVDPANYTEDDDLLHAGYTSGSDTVDLIYALNNLIYHTYLDDDDVDLTKGGEWLSLASQPICLAYVILDFLRNGLPSGTGTGNFLSTAEWNALTAAASNFLTN